MDYLNYTLVGIPKTMGHDTLTSNAKIAPIGYIENGVYHPFMKDVKNDIFGPSGEVFAFKFFDKYPKLLGTTISFHVLPNINLEGKDRYVWNFKKETCAFGIEAKKYPVGTLSLNDSAVNNLFIGKQTLKEGDVIYAVCDNYLYRIIKSLSDKGYIECWDMKQPDFINSIHDGKERVIILREPSIPPMLLDKMSNAAIMAWFLQLAKKAYPELADVIKENQITIRKIIPFLEPLNIPQEIMNNRLRKVFKILDNISITKDQLEDLATTPIFKDLIRRSIDEYKQDFFEQSKTEINEKFDLYKKSIDSQKKEIEETVQKKEKELKDVVEKIVKAKKDLEDQKTLLKTISERKDALLSDFDIIKEVIQYTSVSQNSIQRTSVNVERYDKELKPIIDVDDFNLRLSYYMSIHGIKCSSSVLTSLLANYKILLVPDNRMPQAIIEASGNCSYIVDYVGVKWCDASPVFEDLKIITQECENNPTNVFYFVLRNMNMSYLPCYLQPLLDIISGVCSYYSDTKMKYPDNLRIIGTITSEPGMPLSVHCLKEIGCFPKSKVKDADAIMEEPPSGYLTMEILNDETVLDAENYYKEYVVDEE